MHEVVGLRRSEGCSEVEGKSLESMGMNLSPGQILF